MRDSPSNGKRFAIVLAAGRASRMGKLKQVLPLNGRPLVRHVVEAARAASVDGVVVVTGHGAPAVAEALKGLPVCTVHNRHYDDGLASSLRAGVSALPAEAECAVVLLADQPDVSAEVIDELIDAVSEPGVVASAVSYHDARDAPRDEGAPRAVRAPRAGAPCALRASLFARAAELTGDRGAQALLRKLGERVKLIEVKGEALIDLDTPEAYERARGRTRSS